MSYAARMARMAAAAAAAAAQQNSSYTGTFNADGVQISSNIRRQTAVIYDILSEGPIEGLVDGPASIRLNDNPVASVTNQQMFLSVRSIDVSYNHSTGVVTDNTGIMLANKSTADGGREMLVEGAKKRTTGTITVTAGNNIITSSNSSFFASDDVVSPQRLGPMLRIDGAGRDGKQLIVPITQFISSPTAGTSQVRVEIPPMTSQSGTNAYVDYLAPVTAISGNTATITAGGVTVANTGAILSNPQRSVRTKPVYNYQNFGFAFRTGTREQPFLPTPAGIGSASVAFNVSNGNLDTDSSSGMPAPSNFFSSQPSEYTGSPLIITSDQMGVGNASEIDAVKVTIAFPSLISQKETGKKGEGYAEYRIQFGYKRGNDNFVDVVKVGRQTISTSTSRYDSNAKTKDPSSGMITAKTQQPFNKVFTIDVSRYQPFDKYRITIQRISPVNGKENKWQQTNAGTVKQIENIITDKLRYPYTAYAAVVVDAEDFQQVPKRGYKIRGLKVKVPTNYFPRDEVDASTGLRRTTASYQRNVTSGAEESSVQDWDGNFRGDKKTFSSPDHANHEPVYTNNPIWVFYDLLTNHRYGLGKYLDEDFDFSLIDKYTLFQLAKYCDEAVPDGKGGTEPRFTCNLYIQKDGNAIKVLKNLATLVRSMLIWYNGEVTLGSNIQKGSVYTFTKANVINGSFAYSGSANRFRNNQIAVSWNDPDDGYKQAVEVVEDHNEIARTGKFRRKNITAYGCTSRGQAQRLGRYHLVTERTEQEVVNFSTGINAAILKPGDVIDIQDPDVKDVVASGRVTTSSSSTTTVIKTDRDLTSYLNNTDSFKLNLIYPSGGAYLSQPLATINSTDYVQGDLILLDEDGAAIDTHAKASNLKDDSGAVVQTIWSEDVRIETKPISAFDSTSITVSSAFSAVPDGEVVYTVSGTAAATGADVEGSLKQYIINSISPDDKQIYQISASDYNVNKYDEVDRGWVEPVVPDIARRPKRDEVVPEPTGLNVSVVPSGDGQEEQDEFGITSYDVILNWTLPKSTRTDDEIEKAASNTDGELALDDVYEHLAGFNIQHNIKVLNEDFNEKDFTTVASNQISTGTFTIRNVEPGNGYIVRVQTVNTQGFTSGYIQTEFDFPASMVNPFGAGVVGTGLNGGIQKGGSLTATVDINSSTGAITLSNNDYVFTPPSGVAGKIISSGGTNTIQETAFSNLSNGEEGLLLMDYDDNSDCLKALKVVTDTTAEDPSTETKFNYNFIARLGESSNDLVAASGTVSTTADSPTVTGSSTAFSSDFSVGDVIAFQSAGANRFMAVVMFIESNTSLTVDRGIPHTYSGVSVHKQGFKLDGLRDSVIGIVKRASNVYTYEPFTNKLKIDSSSEIADNTVNAAIIAQNSIGSVQISTNSIGAAAIIADAINDSHIAANSIDSVMIQTGQVGSNEIAANAIGSVAIAANAITSSQLSANAISEVTVSANSITAVEIASNAIGSAQIAANSIASAEITANSIGSSEISANSVNGTIITGNAVGSSEISANSVNGIIIAGGAVDTSQIAGSAISAAKLAAEAVTEEKIQDDAVSNPKIAANAVETVQLKANSVTAAIIVANAIGTSEIAANAINAVIISANAIGTNQIATNSINAAAILANSITNSQIASNTINSAVIQAGAVGENQIGANAITSAKIAANAVDTAEIKANAIGAAQIAANSIDTAEIVSGSIDNIHITAVGTDKLSGTISNAQIAANAITAAKIAANEIATAEIAANSITTLTIATGAVGAAQISSINADTISTGTLAAARIDVDNLVLPVVHNSVSGATIGTFNNNTMRVKEVGSIGTEPGIYTGYVRVFGGSGQVKTLEVVVSDSTFGSGSGSTPATFGILRNNFEYDSGSENGDSNQIPIANTGNGFAQYASGASKYWSRVDRFNSTYAIAQISFSFRKTSANTVTSKLYVNAQGDGNSRSLTRVEYAFYRFSES